MSGDISFKRRHIQCRQWGKLLYIAVCRSLNCCEISLSIKKGGITTPLRYVNLVENDRFFHHLVGYLITRCNQYQYPCRWIEHWFTADVYEKFNRKVLSHVMVRLVWYALPPTVFWNALKAAKIMSLKNNNSDHIMSYLNIIVGEGRVFLL